MTGPTGTGFGVPSLTQRLQSVLWASFRVQGRCVSRFYLCTSRVGGIVHYRKLLK